MRKQVLHPRTAAINQKQKSKSKHDKLNALRWLQITFPQVFDNRTKIRPLHVGIMQDILAYADDAAVHGISKSKLREAVVLFTRRLDYLACLKAREMRIDLFGNPTVMVSDDEAEQAALKMRSRVEKSIKNSKKSTFVGLPKRNKALSFAAEYNSADSGLTDVVSPRVIVTHKTARSYDPVAVARLKEKLGISQKVAIEKD